MGRHRREWHILQAAKHEAVLAVDLYNRPLLDRSLEAFTVHMNIAWTYLAHALFTRDGLDFRYRDDRGRFQRVDGGQIKTWELSRCVKELYPHINDPVRRNIEFFIPLRNMVEHRYAHMLEAVIAGRAQSYILNFEHKVIAEFGVPESLASVLRLPVFLTTLTEDATEGVKHAYNLLPTRMRNFISSYDDQLPQEVRDHPAYEFKIYLLPKTSSRRTADAAIEFVRLEDLPDELRGKIEEVRVIIRDRQVPTANQGNMRPKAVAVAVQARIPFRFSHYTHHGRAVKHFGVRGTGPTSTDGRYCVYDEANDTYLYTRAWVEKLVHECSTAEGFATVCGCAPHARDGALVADTPKS